MFASLLQGSGDEVARLRVEIANINARWKQKVSIAEEASASLIQKVSGLETRTESLEKDLANATNSSGSTAARAVQEKADLMSQLQVHCGTLTQLVYPDTRHTYSYAHPHSMHKGNPPVPLGKTEQD